MCGQLIYVLAFLFLQNQNIKFEIHVKLAKS